MSQRTQREFLSLFSRGENRRVRRSAPLQTALRAKALSSLERDKLQRRVEELEAEIASLKKDTLLQSETPLPEAGATEERRRERPRLQDSTWPPVSTTSPLKEASSSAAAEPLDAQSLKQVAAVTLPGEVGPTSLAFHPSVPLSECACISTERTPTQTQHTAEASRPSSTCAVETGDLSSRSVAASGEDGKWSLWSLPSAELVMGGEGHEARLQGRPSKAQKHQPPHFTATSHPAGLTPSAEVCRETGVRLRRVGSAALSFTRTARCFSLRRGTRPSRRGASQRRSVCTP